MRRAFVFDQNKCTGCQACQLACVIENGLPPDKSWRRIFTFNDRHDPGAPLFHLSLACNHCADPACMSACPALAYGRDAETGAVLVDPGKCIGCRYCTWACPFDAPKFDHGAGVVTKCTFCVHRISRGLAPACVALCPTGALGFDRLPEEELTVKDVGFTATTMRPAIKIIPFRNDHWAAPGGDASPTRRFAQPQPAMPRRVTLRSEWSLAAFTLAAALLFALLIAAVAGKPAVEPIPFALAAGAAMALGGAHLGRKERAWRAVLNVSGSWLSREIVSYSLFVALGTLYLARPGDLALGLAAAVMGFAALFSMDRVYKFALGAASPLPHSASVVLTGPFLGGILMVNAGATGILGLSKLVLYAARKTDLKRAGAASRPSATAIRVGIGLVLPGVMWFAGGEALLLPILACALLGECVDRGEFYAEMDMMTPTRQMVVDLQARLRATDDVSVT